MKRRMLKSELTGGRARLVDLIQQVRFGRIENLFIRGGEPVWEPEPDVFKEFMTDKDNGPHPLLGVREFELKPHFRVLFDYLDKHPDVKLENVRIQDGLPMRYQVRQRTAA